MIQLLISLAKVSFTFNTATCLAGVEHGTGRHYWDIVDPKDLSDALMVSDASKLAVGYVLALTSELVLVVLLLELCY